MIDEIPILDMGPLVSGRPGAARGLGSQIRAACLDYGFFFIRNHGVPQTKIDAVFAAARRFFALDLEQKLRVKIDENNLGYMPMKGSTLKTETLNKNTKPNLNESFFIMRERSPDDPDVLAKKRFRGLNRWPDGLPGFRDVLLDYQATMEALAKKLLGGFTAAFGIDHAAFTVPFAEPQISLRLAHYPHQAIVGNNEFGAAPHTDFGFMTLLAPTTVPGLEIMPTGRDWIRAPALSDCYLVNTGDLLQRWTNDVFKSTPHRVINSSGWERFSIPFFFSPNSEFAVDTLDVFITADNPKKYPPITYAAYYGDAIHRNYAHHQDKDKPRVDVA
ncbi:MAG TPA: 2-oxoglutarate and iron-dependent oxygenase domain-containing protein [Alphaproteobacteria bacterium]